MASHPHELRIQGYLSCAELKHWITEFLSNPDYGICTVKGGKSALRRAMGCKSLDSKTKVSWIYPSEQRRFTQVVMRIRRGEIRLVRIDEKNCDFSVCDPPRPPKPMHEQTRWHFVNGKLTKLPPPDSRPLTPSLHGLMDRAKFRK